MRVVIVAAGDLDAADARWLGRADLVIAADGGADSLERLGHRPDVIVGDLDSADPAIVERMADAGTRVERHPSDKDASDTELALAAAIAAGATEVILLGSLGGTRLDHQLANVLLLADRELATADVRLVQGATSARVLTEGARLDLEGGPGDLVTLLPLGGDAAGVTTEGLRWPLDAALLTVGRSRGLSNEVTSRPASVSLEHGALLVIETAKEGSTLE
jgi:thiamine pyrophosphokinase